MQRERRWMGSDGSTRWISSMDTATAAHATASSAHVAPFGVRMASCAAFQDLWDVLGASRRFAALGAVPDHGAGQSTCASAPGRRCMEDDLRGLLGRGEDGSFQT
eukprot:jgi/Pico_ML_1/55322/g1022.t1